MTELYEKKLDEKIQIAINLQKSEQFEKARLIYESILKNKPNSFQTLYLLGTLEAQCCNFDKSLTYLLRANKINSNSWEVNYNIGNACVEINEFKSNPIKNTENAIKERIL